MRKKFKFIDLFSGIGGFHQALSALGGECVFASDIDIFTNKVYEENYGLSSAFDITKVEAENIPKHDVLAAGFPCQAFSKAGKQAGINDTRGTLFFDILRILRHHKTRYIILENVRNLISHDEGKTWRIIKKSLKSLGYRISEEPIILSPHQFGIPQLRERVFILGELNERKVDEPFNLKLTELKTKEQNSIYSILEPRASEKYNISEYEENILTAWDEFYKGIKCKTLGFPVWYDYFRKEKTQKMPDWKALFVEKNNILFNENREFIEVWEKNITILKVLDRHIENLNGRQARVFLQSSMG